MSIFEFGKGTHQLRTDLSEILKESHGSAGKERAQPGQALGSGRSGAVGLGKPPKGRILKGVFYEKN